MVKKETKNKKRGSGDPGWDHCSRVAEGRMNLKCNYCGTVRWGGITRMKHHLAGDHSNIAECEQCPQEVRDLFKKLLGEMKTNEAINVECFEEDEPKRGTMDAYVIKGEGKKGKEARQRTLNEMVKKREPVIRDICRFFYGHALAFNLVKSPLFARMVKSIGDYGKGLKPPTYHECRVSYLKKEVNYVQESMESYKQEWKRTGCTIMSDGWSDGKSRSITNFPVNSPKGTVFINSIDTSPFIKDANKLFDLLDDLVEQIGEEHVVQVVTDSASAFVLAGTFLQEKRKKLFWSPCAAHCIDLMLKDIGEIPIFKDTIEKAKSVAIYIYHHAWVLSMFRRFSKKRELTRAGVTRFATAFLNLKSFDDHKLPLRRMFLSEEWVKGPYALKNDAKKVETILLNDDEKFWKAIKYCLKCVGPLVKVLRLVDGDVKPAMGYVYEAMDRAKEQIAENFNHEKKRYEAIWKIIDTRWDLQLHRPLHAAGYFLNPKFQYDPTFNADLEVKVGLIRTIERMYPDVETRIKIDEQLEKFKRAEGLFGMSMAKLTRDKKQPALWWESYGEECKELQSLAIRVLILTCSATGCERNWSTFDHIHSKKRNRLETQRLNALVFVKYNIQLELRQEKRQQRGETYDPICLSDMESDDEWITEREDPCLPVDSSWMDIHECFQEVGTSNKRKRGPRNLNAIPTKKGKGKVVEDDDVHLMDEEEEEEGEFEEEEEDEEVVELIDDNEDDADDLDDLDGF